MLREPEELNKKNSLVSLVDTFLRKKQYPNYANDMPIDETK